MEYPPANLVEYVRKALSEGRSVQSIGTELLRSGWPKEQVDAAFLRAGPAPPPPPHRVRNGVLWIISPAVLLILVALIQVISRAAGVTSALINILSILGGLVGVLLVPIGPIIGIIKLNKH